MGGTLKEDWKEREKMYACWLCSFPGMGNGQLHQLWELCGGFEAVYFADRQTWGRVLSARQVEGLAGFTARWRPQEEYCRIRKEGIRLLTFWQEGYPERLKTIPDAPFGLFLRGKLPKEDMPTAAVIGARDCSEYGRHVARLLGETLGRRGIAVVSGMARGIDGISQEAALEAGGYCVGVLGSGVDVCYPVQNRGLYERLVKQGAVLSSYPGGTPARPQNFPPRNRIVSGLADVVVVIEARVKSGTLITVDMALEQGREVYVVPGRVTDRLSDGCNRLIRQGAGVVLDLEEFAGEVWEIWESKRNNHEAGILTQRRRYVSGKTGQSGKNLPENGNAICAKERQEAEGTTVAEKGQGTEAEGANVAEKGQETEAKQTVTPEKRGGRGQASLGEVGRELSPDLAAVYQALDFYPRSTEKIIQELAFASERAQPLSDRQAVTCLMQLCMEDLAIQVSPGHFCRKG